jgi:hypothetical protein
MNPKDVDTTPQLSIIREIQRLAPKRTKKILDGTSTRKYPIKKIPAPKPKATSDMLRASLI